MYEPNEAILKDMAARECDTRLKGNPLGAAATQTSGCCGEGCIGEAGDYRPSMRENINNHLRHAQQESRRAVRLEELSFLLDKNPEVARILDLLEILKG